MAKRIERTIDYGRSSQPRKFNFIRNHVKEFCDKTTIHGLRYVTEDGANWCQSIIWSFFVIIGTGLCIILMVLVWQRFSYNPTVTAVETVNYPIWNIPFPAVTVCNSNKVQKSNIEKSKKILLSNGWNDTEANQFFKYLSSFFIAMQVPSNFTKEFQTLKNNGYTVETLMLELMQPCEKLLIRCVWTGEVIPCKDLFKISKTEEGFCCSFNYYFTNETFEELDSSPYKDLPLSSSGAGIHTGLAITLDLQEDQYVSSTKLTPSASVHVHENWDYPEIRALGTNLERGNLAMMTLNPIVVDSTEDVKSVSRAKRNCIFEDEAQISIGQYGYENCIIECRLNAVVDLCGCVPYYYNVNYYNYKNVSRFCEIADMMCVYSNNDRLYSLGSADSKVLNWSSKATLNCECYPTCDVFWYPYSADIGYVNDFQDDAKTPGLISAHVYFSELSCLKYKQSTLITWDGLFASFGGVFGLCLGGSMLSLAEIVYHFTIRLYSSYFGDHRIREKRPNKWNVKKIKKSKKIDKKIDKPKSVEVYVIGKEPFLL